MILVSRVRRTGPVAGWVAGWALGISLLGAPARAEDQDAINRTAARDLAQQAADAFDAADYATALDKFTRAQQLYPAPTLSFMQARCLFALGRWVEAFEVFNATARTALPLDAPEPFQRAVNDARIEAQLLEARLPRIEIQVPKHPGLNVSVDDLPLSSALHNVSHPMNPGEHRVQALLGERPYFEQTVTLVERDRQTVEIPPPPKPEAAVVSPMPAPHSPPPVTDHGPEPRPRSTPNWVIPTAFTIGGVGTAGAVVSLILGTGVQSDLDAVCRDDGHGGRACPDGASDDMQTYRLYRIVFISGAVLGAAGVGVGLYFVLDDSPDSTAVSLSLEPDGAVLRGHF